MEISSNYSNPSFGSIQGSAKAIMKKLGDKAIPLILEQKANKAADIVISDLGGISVRAKNGASLPYGLGEKGVQEFKIYSAHSPEWLHCKVSGVDQNFNTHSIDAGIVGSYHDELKVDDICFNAARKIADDTLAKETGYAGCRLSDEQTEKMIGALVNLEI